MSKPPLRSGFATGVCGVSWLEYWLKSLPHLGENNDTN